VIPIGKQALRVLWAMESIRNQIFLPLWARFLEILWGHKTIWMVKMLEIEKQWSMSRCGQQWRAWQETLYAHIGLTEVPAAPDLE
jgi:hypothetical protein